MLTLPIKKKRYDMNSLNIKYCPSCGRLMVGRFEYYNGVPRYIHRCDFCNYRDMYDYSYSNRTEEKNANNNR